MRRIATALAVAALLAGVSMTLLAQSGSGGPALFSASLDAQVAKLLAMPAKERRAELKKLSPAERRGLWMAVKKGSFNRGDFEPGSYKNLEGFPVNVPQGFKGKKVTTKAALGTIVYDSGFPDIGFGGGQLVGNHFNTHTGIPVCNPGTVSTVQALVVPGPANTTSSAGFVLLGPQTTMGGAMALFSTFTPATGVIDSVTFAGLGVTYTGSDFFVLFGDFASSYIPVLGPGSTLGQGFHGLVGYTGGMGPSITGTFNLGGFRNTFIRTTGIIVPVELMKFEVD